MDFTNSLQLESLGDLLTMHSLTGTVLRSVQTCGISASTGASHLQKIVVPKILARFALRALITVIVCSFSPKLKVLNGPMNGL